MSLRPRAKGRGRAATVNGYSTTASPRSTAAYLSRSVAVGVVCAIVAGPVICGAVAGGIGGFWVYWYTHHGGHGFTYKGAAKATLAGAAVGSFGGAVGKALKYVGGKVFKGYADRASQKAWNKMIDALKK